MSGLMERLRKHKEDRGMMANLRCVYVPSKQQRAWPSLGRLGVDVTNDVDALIAGLYATHPSETGKGDFGAVCKAIDRKREGGNNDESKLTPVERRFQHLLAAEYGDELQGRVLRMILMAKSYDIPVNYESLRMDMKYWGDRTKAKWAASFWNIPAAEEKKQLNEQEAQS